MRRIHLLLLTAVLVGAFWLPLSAQTSEKTASDLKITESAVAAKTDEKNKSSFEAEIIAEVNIARNNPEIYVKALEDLKKYYKGNELSLPNETPVETNEGIAAVDEAIEFLRNLKPSGEVKADSGLASAAKVHLNDLAEHNLTGHKGSDGSMPDDRLARFGTWEGQIAELIDYGGKSAREVVLKLLIDDGVANRAHRLKLLSPNFKIIGLASGKDKSDKNLSVLVLGEDFSASTNAGVSPH